MKTIVAPHGWRRSSRFNKAALPLALCFYTAEGLKLVGRGEWRSARCPFHRDNTPSFAVNIRSGAFHCFGCEASGGDVIDYLRLRYGKSFVEAARALGAWED